MPVLGWVVAQQRSYIVQLGEGKLAGLVVQEGALQVFTAADAPDKSSLVHPQLSGNQTPATWSIQQAHFSGRTCAPCFQKKVYCGCLRGCLCVLSVVVCVSCACLCGGLCGCLCVVSARLWHWCLLNQMVAGSGHIQIWQQSTRKRFFPFSNNMHHMRMSSTQ